MTDTFNKIKINGNIIELEDKFSRDSISNIENTLQQKQNKLTAEKNIEIYEEDSLTKIKQKSYIHNQDIASDTWTIHHGLGKVPSVYVQTMKGNRLICPMRIVSMDEIVLEMQEEFSGIAYLS